MIHLLFTGGTISMHRDSAAGGNVPAHGGEALVGLVCPRKLRIQCDELRQKISTLFHVRLAPGMHDLGQLPRPLHHLRLDGHRNYSLA